jgi:uncharacterized protein (DUF2267 family)
MAATGLDVFDKSLQTTHIWLDEIMEKIGPDRRVAYRVLRAVLHALRDRLEIDEAAQLAAQLPMVVRGIYYDSWDPRLRPEPIRSVDDFLAKIADELRDTRPVDPEDAARAVFGVIARHVSAGEVEDVKSQLPEPIRRLWPESAAVA